MPSCLPYPSLPPLEEQAPAPAGQREGFTWKGGEVAGPHVRCSWMWLPLPEKPLGEGGGRLSEPVGQVTKGLRMGWGSPGRVAPWVEHLPLHRKAAGPFLVRAPTGEGLQPGGAALWVPSLWLPEEGGAPSQAGCYPSNSRPGVTVLPQTPEGGGQQPPGPSPAGPASFCRGLTCWSAGLSDGGETGSVGEAPACLL